MERITDADNTDVDEYIILNEDKAAQAIFLVYVSQVSSAKHYKAMQNRKGNFCELLDDASDKTEAIIKAMDSSIDQSKIVTHSNSKTSNDGSLVITEIAPHVNKVMDKSCLPSDLREDTTTLGCTETSYSKGAAYPKTHMTIDNVHYCDLRLHALRCRVENGARPKGFTASHMCQNSKCINSKHLRWETLRDNLKRKGCYGYVMLEKGDKFKFVKSTKCTHKERCNNFFRVNVED